MALDITRSDPVHANRGHMLNGSKVLLTLPAMRVQHMLSRQMEFTSQLSSDKECVPLDANGCSMGMRSSALHSSGLVSEKVGYTGDLSKIGRLSMIGKHQGFHKNYLS